MLLTPSLTYWLVLGINMGGRMRTHRLELRKRGKYAIYVWRKVPWYVAAWEYIREGR